MGLVSLRPTFVIPLSCDRPTATARLQTVIQRRYRRELGFMAGEYAEFNIPVEQHRVWSPHLSVYLDGDHPPIQLRGRYAPRQDVWAFIWIIYLAMSCTAFFGAIFGVSQWMLDHTAWGWLVAILSVAIMLILHLVAVIGQSWSSDQMQQLRDELNLTLIEADVIDPAVVAGTTVR